MYKKGDKFIIEINEVKRDFDTMGEYAYFYKFKGCDKAEFAESIIDKFENYTNTNKTYEQGLKNAYKTIKKLYTLDKEDIKVIFGKEFWVEDILNLFSIETVMNEIKAYEDKQNEIKVGDEILVIDGKKAVVTQITEHGIYYVLFDGACRNIDKIDFVEICKKTGKHYPQVEEMLKALKNG